MAYNLTNITDAVSDPATLAEIPVHASGGIYYTILIIAIYIILMMRLYREGVGRSSAAASFVCIIISAPLLYLGWIDPAVPVMSALVLAGSLFYVKYIEG